ncbi:MAG: F0F1 ATP synthase subunit delta, partial [Pseudomonadota bacterium]
MDLRTAARPYAKAAFAVATEEKQQESWLQELRLLAALTQSNSAKAVFDPALS